MTREEAIAFMRKVWREAMKGSYAEEAYEMAIEALKERPIGHWIDDGDCSICSKCHEAYGLTLLGRLYTPNFCPNCGADMRGGDDD